MTTRSRWPSQNSKAMLRKNAARTFDVLCHALADMCDLFDPAQCRNFFKAAGYEPY